MYEDVEAIVLANHLERKWRDKIKENCRKERERLKKEHTYKLIREIEATIARIAYILTGAIGTAWIFSINIGSPVWIAISAILGVASIVAAVVFDKEVYKNG